MNQVQDEIRYTLYMDSGSFNNIHSLEGYSTQQMKMDQTIIYPKGIALKARIV